MTVPERLLQRMQFAACAEPSTVVIAWPSAIAANMVRALIARITVSTTTQHPAAGHIATDIHAVQAQILAQEIREQRRAPRRRAETVPLTVTVILMRVLPRPAASTPFERAGSQHARHVFLELGQAPRVSGEGSASCALRRRPRTSSRVGCAPVSNRSARRPAVRSRRPRRSRCRIRIVPSAASVSPPPEDAVAKSPTLRSIFGVSAGGAFAGNREATSSAISPSATAVANDRR